MDLFQKYMSLIREELKVFGIFNLEGRDDQEIIALNFNLKTKMIINSFYVVKESPEVLAKISSLDTDYNEAYEEIKKRILNSDDVNPFLSKQALNPELNDYLFLDWNIHHLHLNKENLGSYFNERSDYLLMILFKENIAYFIDVEFHPNDDVFVKKEYLKIIKDNWPGILEPCELKGVADLNFHPTNEEISAVRNQQVRFLLKIDDKVYVPLGGGISTAGAGMQHLTKAIQWKHYIDSLEIKYKITERNVLQDIFKKTGKAYSDLDLNFMYHGENDNAPLVLIDKNSQVILEKVAT
jgi:hypothetical protein